MIANGVWMTKNELKICLMVRNAYSSFIISPVGAHIWHNGCLCCVDDIHRVWVACMTL